MHLSGMSRGAIKATVSPQLLRMRTSENFKVPTLFQFSVYVRDVQLVEPLELHVGCYFRAQVLILAPTITLRLLLK